MSKVIGIDLGTTNSCVSVMEGSVPKVIPNREGTHTNPSIVAFTEKGERLVGQIAKRQSLTNPRNTVYAVKRLLGRKFQAPEVQKAKNLLPYQIVEASNGDVRIRIQERDYSCQEISGMILKRLKDMAEDYIGSTVTEAVITVPAYFDDSQRQATKDAGQIAGLQVSRIVNEPTAAALAYRLDESAEKRIAVYDLGGGTFDISILQLGGGVFEVKATSGNSFLGGEDFDQRIVKWLLEEFQKREGIDLHEDRLALQRLKEAAEKAKCELSSSAKCEVNLPFISADEKGPKHLNLVLTRDIFESLVNDLIELTRQPCLEALQMAGLTAGQVNEVLLVGGQTRTPKVVETVRSIFGKDACSDRSPDEVVGIGAAIQGAILQGEVKDIILLDVTPLSLGIETRGGMFTKLIERNTTIPTRKGRIFTTVMDNQDKVEIHVLQGEREIAAHNKSLGRFEMVGIPSAPRGVPQIEVSFEIDSNGIVNVSARDNASNQQQAMVVTPSSGLTEKEVQKVIEEARLNEESDRKRAELQKIQSRLESLLDSNMKTFAEFGKSLAEEQRLTVKGILDEARRALQGTSVAKSQESLERLGEAAQILTEVILYNPSQFSTQPDKPAAGGEE